MNFLTGMHAVVNLFRWRVLEKLEISFRSAEILSFFLFADIYLYADSVISDMSKLFINLEVISGRKMARDHHKM